MLFVPIPANTLILLWDDKSGAQNGALQTDQAAENCNLTALLPQARTPRSHIAMDKALKIAVIIGALFAGFGVFYHFVIFLPGVEREKAIAAEARRVAYDRCIDWAQRDYDADWAAACKTLAATRAKELKDCLSDKTVTTNPYLGPGYCKRMYADAESSPECTLPRAQADSINAAHKQQQQRCATEARLGLR